jgi:hypothetical protein
VSDAFQAIAAVGVESIALRHGCKVEANSFSPCPSCGATTRHTKRKDKRLACVIVQSGRGWLCLQCNSKGDTVDLYARLHNLGKRPTDKDAWRSVLRAWEGEGATYPAPTPGKPPYGAARGLPGALLRPSHLEIRALWDRSYLVPPESAYPWLADKFPAYTIADIIEAGVARWLPRETQLEWWPWQHRYIAMLAFDSKGYIQSIHGRVAGKVDPDKPKSRFPKGYSASGLVLANKTAVSWMKGKMKVSSVVIAEGLTSTLATTMAMRKTDKWDWAVLGYTSGSGSAIKDMPWTDQTVYIVTDNDKAGNLYADKIAKALPVSLNLRRGNVTR